MEDFARGDTQRHRRQPLPVHRLRDGVADKELGPDYLAKLQPLRLTPCLVKLQSLGHQVTLTPTDQAA